jgi:N-methylhydantoinase B/oxoprolinase/acetone carboxylase alpha subunit
MPDPVTVEVIRNAFNSIAAQMNNNLARSAYTPIIYEMKDCSVGVFDADARLLGQAPGLPIFLGNLEAAIHVTTEKLGGSEHYEPGDVLAVNDSYLTGSHLNDVSIFFPVSTRASSSASAPPRRTGSTSARRTPARRWTPRRSTRRATGSARRTCTGRASRLPR